MTTRTRANDPPAHLSDDMRAWWAHVEREHLLEPHHRHLLRLASEAYDEAATARKVLDEQGLTFCDRFGQPRLRPEAAVERDARRDFAKLVAQLDLDEDPPVGGSA